MSDTHSQVKTLVDEHGIRAIADHLHVSYESLKSIYAGAKVGGPGLTVHAGTMALVEKNLKKPFPKKKAVKK